MSEVGFPSGLPHHRRDELVDDSNGLFGGRFGRDEILFLVAVAGLIAMTISAVVYDKQSDATLVAAFVGLLGLPVFLSSGKKEDK